MMLLLLPAGPHSSPLEGLGVDDGDDTPGDDDPADYGCDVFDSSWKFLTWRSYLRSLVAL